MDKIRVTRLAFVHYQHPDLDRAVEFYRDFGLIEESRKGDKVYLRGYGIDPYVYVAEKSPDGKRNFLGGYWATASEEDLLKASKYPGASPITELDGLGGGKYVVLKDPVGFNVGFVFGQKLRESDAQTAAKLEKPSNPPNFVQEKPRQGQFRRFIPGASPVHKLGHYGFGVPPSKFKETLNWYHTIMNLKPTDTVYNPQTGEDQTTFNHIDLGENFTDHHSFFIGSDPSGKPPYIHHSSFEVNDFDTQSLGHQWLEQKKWVNCWGIGRHVLGSQIFDYWFDASGNVVEHYSDGDLVNQDTPAGREPEAPNTLYVWGPNIPLAFVTGRMEDAGKPLMAPPDAQNASPAEFAKAGA